MTSSLGSENSAIGTESPEKTPSLHLSIGLRSIGPEKQSPTTMPSNLPDSLTGESTLQKAGERPSAVLAESSPSIEFPNASSQQVLPLVPNSTSGQTFCFLTRPVLHIQAPLLTPIVEYPPSILTLKWNLHLSVHFGECKVPALQSLQKKEHECNPPSRPQA